jgi:hypothetical protein
VGTTCHDLPIKQYRAGKLGSQLSHVWREHRINWAWMKGVAPWDRDRDVSRMGQYVKHRIAEGLTVHYVLQHMVAQDGCWLEVPEELCETGVSDVAHQVYTFMLFQIDVNDLEAPRLQRPEQISLNTRLDLSSLNSGAGTHVDDGGAILKVFVGSSSQPISF